MQSKILILIILALCILHLISCNVPDETDETTPPVLDTPIQEQLSAEDKVFLKNRYLNQFPIIPAQETFVAPDLNIVISDSYEFLKLYQDGEISFDGALSADPSLIPRNIQICKFVALDLIMPHLSLGMTSDNIDALAYEQSHLWLNYDEPTPAFTSMAEVAHHLTRSDRSLPLILTSETIDTYMTETSDGHLIKLHLSPAGTGTEADPFRAVVSEIWVDGELYDACDTVAEEMALGILPTFLAVELHGTEYLVSQGLITTDEALLYAEEQAVYLASQNQAEVEQATEPVVLE